MARLQNLKPRIQALKTSRLSVLPTASDKRITGRRLQDRRLRLWAKSPVCAGCGRQTQYPEGFELDHKLPLFQGGEDTDENCQVLCVWYDEKGQKQGCHDAKTRGDGGFQGRDG